MTFPMTQQSCWQRPAGHRGTPWAYWQIRTIAGCACSGNAGNVFPSPRVSDPDLHHGTCVTLVPWCMPRSLSSGFLWSRWRGKRSRHPLRMRNPQFCVSSKRPVRVILNMAQTAGENTLHRQCVNHRTEMQCKHVRYYQKSRVHSYVSNKAQYVTPTFLYYAWELEITVQDTDIFLYRYNKLSISACLS